jgi:8-oxo-dGTP diphosphatase
MDQSARTLSISGKLSGGSWVNIIPSMSNRNRGGALSTDLQGTEDAPKRYQFVARTLIFVYRDSKVLLLKGAPHKRLWANRYNGIGGHIDQGESVIDSALRELQEEAGLTQITDLRLRGIITIDPNTISGILIFLFTASTQQSAVQASDEGTPEWIDWRTLPPISMVEDLPVLLEKLESLQPSDPPFYAHYSYDESGVLSIRFRDH